MVYALLEVVIGLWGLINVWLLPSAGRALPPLLGTEPAPALLWAMSFALPTLVLLPATVAMGGTLTALERMMTAARGDARVSAGVYGANTAGAVAGTLGFHILAASRIGFVRYARLSCRRERCCAPWGPLHWARLPGERRRTPTKRLPIRLEGCA